MGNPFWKGFRRKRHLKSFLVKNEDATPVFPELDATFELIKQGSPLGSREIAKKLNIHQNTVLKRLKLLEEKGLIFKQGSGPRVRYTI